MHEAEFSIYTYTFVLTFESFLKMNNQNPNPLLHKI